MANKDNKTYQVLGFSPREGCSTTTYTLVEDILPGQDEPELICLHPSIPKTFRFEDGRDENEKNIYVDVPTDHRFTQEHIHAVRCRCSKCSGLLDSMMDTISKNKDVKVKEFKDDKGSVTTTITTSPKGV